MKIVLQTFGTMLRLRTREKYYYYNGELQYWTNDSDHYQPGENGAANMVDILRKNGLEDISIGTFVVNKYTSWQEVNNYE